MKKAKTVSVYILFIAGLLLFLGLMLLGNILTIGEKLSKISMVLEYAFYTIALVATYVLLVHPVVSILVKPTFSIREFLSSHKEYDYRKCVQIAKNLVKNKSLSAPDIDRLFETINRGGDVQSALVELFSTTIPNDMDSVIKNEAQRAMISTMISPNGKLDSVVLLVMNIRLIQKLIDRCGYKPSIPQLVKTFINILATSLLFASAEDIDLEEMLPAFGNSALSAIPGLSYMLTAVFQGVGSALFTLRIGYIARNYLLDGSQTSQGGVRSSATKEAFKALPSVIRDAVVILPQSVQEFVNKTMTSSKGI